MLTADIPHTQEWLMVILGLWYQHDPTFSRDARPRGRFVEGAALCIYCPRTEHVTENVKHRESDGRLRCTWVARAARVEVVAGSNPDGLGSDTSLSPCMAHRSSSTMMALLRISNSIIMLGRLDAITERMHSDLLLLKDFVDKLRVLTEDDKHYDNSCEVLLCGHTLQIMQDASRWQDPLIT